MKKLFFILSVLCSPALFSQTNECSNAKIRHYTSAQKKNNASGAQMEQMEKYDVVFHHLNLNFERTSTYLSAMVRTLAVCKVPQLDTFFFQLHRNLSIDSVLTSSNQHLVVTRLLDVAYVLMAQPVAFGNMLDLRIYYHGSPPDSGSAAIGNGFSNGVSQLYGNRITWSLSQPYSAYEWWPCKQSLQDKIDSAYIFITTDTSNKAASNGLLQAVVPLGNGKHRYEWKTHYPMDYYLIAATVGEYSEYRNYAKPRQLSDSILIQHYYYNNPQTLIDGILDMNRTAAQLELYSDLFGLYPFYKEKYGHVMAPFSGGMEHQTMTSLGYFHFDLCGHELAHQWFGDHVTCATWKDIWLNEGFATYLEYLAEFYLLPASAKNTLAGIQGSAVNSSGTVYVDDTTNVDRIFSAKLTYNKGASAIRVLHYLLGDSLFFRTCKAYQARFANSTANTEDFKHVVNEVSGKDYSFFFDQWIYHGGYPYFTVHWNYADGKLYIKTFQENFDDAANLFTLPIPYQLTLAGGDQVIYLHQNHDTDYFEIKMDPVLDLKSVDPDHWILCAKQIVKDVFLTGLSEKQALQSISIFPNPAQNTLHFVNPNGIKFAISIFDMQGKHCLTQPYLMTSDNLEISFLKAGIYMVELSNETGLKLTHKLVIQ